MAETKRSYRIGDFDSATRSFRVIASTRRPVKAFEMGEDGQPRERLESLESWDLRRFRANPVVLWAHNANDLPIGKASEFEETDEGLEMRVTLAPLSANARTAEIEAALKEGLIRGVSVGFSYGARADEDRDGQRVAIFTRNELHEVSLVPVPADADALIDTEETRAAKSEGEQAIDASRPFAGYGDFAACVLDQEGKGNSNDEARRICGKLQSDEEARRKRLSAAGKELAAGRKRRDAADDEVQRFDVVGRIGKFERTQVGGLRVPARLTRTGILKYTLPDGTVRNELRTAEEVFSADSLETLREAPVTDLAHHRALIDTSNWKEASLGVTTNVRRDADRYIAAELVINDARTVVDVENKRLHDISCGYTCKLDFTPGTHAGEKYDAIQRHIRYNHVAVLPKGVGRAGTDVALRLDAKDAVCVEAFDHNQEDIIMSEPQPKRVIRIDGKDLEYGSEAHVAHIEAAHLADIQKYDGEIAALKTANENAAKELQSKLDETTAKLDAKTKEAEKTEEELAAEKGEKAKARMRSKLRLLKRAFDLLEEDDEEKMDAMLEMSDRDIMVAVIKADANWSDFDGKDKSDDYVAAMFDTVSKKFTRADGVDAVVRTAERARRSDAKEPGDEAREAMIKRNREAYLKPLTAAKAG